jgi:hypothetical protein
LKPARLQRHAALKLKPDVAQELADYGVAR